MMLSFHNSAEIMSFLEALTNDRQSGEVLLASDSAHAKIYLVEGLVLYAFATGQEESFQSILLREQNYDRDSLVEGIKTAREKGKRNLDDILQELGVSEVDIRRKIIARHTRAALHTLNAWQHCRAQFKSSAETFNSTVTALRLDTLIGQTNSPIERLTKAQPELPPESEDLETTLEMAAREIPDLIALFLVERTTGTLIAGVGNKIRLNQDVASAFLGKVERHATEAVQALRVSELDIFEELQLTASEEFFLLRALPKSGHLLIASLERQSNPAMARIAMRKIEERLELSLI